jgi:ketosteroid isomerase-like protein
VTEDDGRAGRSPAQIVGEAMACYDRGDLEALAALVHPEAEIELVAFDGVVHGPDGLVGALAQVREGVHRPTVTSIRAVGADAAVMIGRIQYTDARGSLSDRKAVWLTMLRDGLLWRTHVFETDAQARAFYAGLVEEVPHDAR